MSQDSGHKLAQWIRSYIVPALAASIASAVGTNLVFGDMEFLFACPSVFLTAIIVSKLIPICRRDKRIWLVLLAAVCAGVTAAISYGFIWLLVWVGSQETRINSSDSTFILLLSTRFSTLVWGGVIASNTFWPCVNRSNSCALGGLGATIGASLLAAQEMAMYHILGSENALRDLFIGELKLNLGLIVWAAIIGAAYSIAMPASFTTKDSRGTKD